MIDQKTALGRLTADQFKVMRRPMIDPSFKEKPHLVGLPACPGVVTGRPVFSSAEAVKANDPVILVTAETNPDDIAGMAKAVGILTQTGGATSHAAVVARAMDKPCVVGCSQMELMDGMIGITGKLTNADVTIDGSTGRVWVGVKVPVIDASEDPAIQTVMGWCMSDLGACDLSPVGLGMDKPHLITAAQWWGNESVLDAILADLEELPSREHIALDLQHPNGFAKPTDAALLGAFGQAATSVYDDFSHTLLQQLTKRAAKLKGLTLVNYEVTTMHPAALEKLGYAMGVHPVQVFAKAVPKDYAAFTRLSH
jgi:phosphohistidine swiveling domain-containing protein